MATKTKKGWHILAICMFIVTIALNYLAAFGILFPYTQQEISDLHGNLLAPAGFTFSIWGIIYIGVVASLIFPWVKKLSNEVAGFYYEKIMPPFIIWNLANIGWTITWNTNQILLALIAIIIYAMSLIYLVNVISTNPVFAEEYKWYITYPIGLHAGWLTFAGFTNVMTLLVKNGFAAFSETGVIVTIVLMILACASVLLVLKRYGNIVVTIPALWALFGIFMEQRPDSDFANADQTVMYAAIILFVVALAIHFLLIRSENKSMT